MSENSFIFNVIDWHEFDEIPYEEIENSDSDNSIDKSKTSNADKKYVIKMFGRTENGESVYIRVDDFPPHFYILLPESWKTNIEEKCDYLIDVLKKKSYCETIFDKWEIVYRKKFYGFYAGKKFPFLRIIFKNKKNMMSASRLFDNKICMYSGTTNRANIKDRFIKFNIYESNIDPYIRFIHIQDLHPCGWIKINNDKLIELDEPSTCKYVYKVCWNDILPINDKIGIAPFIVASFDIECKSGDGISFPIPSNINDPIIQIGITLNRYGCQDIYKRIMISLGTCDPIHDVELHICKREKDLLEKFQEVIQKEDPDIYTGYNIFNFDIPYIMDRAKHPDIHINSKFYYMSKLKNYKCKMVTKSLSSSALGDNKLNYIDVKGLQLVRRDNIPYVREVSKEVLNIILESNNPESAKNLAHERAVQLLDGEVPIEKLTLSQKLADSYKSENLPHVQVRNKIKTRSPGSEPQSGDRVQFVIIETNEPTTKQFEKAEDPKWVLENNLKLDYNYYFTNKFMTPICDLLEPLVENPKMALFGDLLIAKKSRKKPEVKCKKIDDLFAAFNNRVKK